MSEKYTKVIYQSKPIGKEQIVLQLTTFDLEAFKKDQTLEKIPSKRLGIVYSFDKELLINNPNLLQEEMERHFSKMIEETYQKQLEDMKGYIEYLRKNGIPQAQWIDLGSEKE